MADRSDEHERTMAFAEIALGQIKALRQPAAPRVYEVWYNYATGYNPHLNQQVNERLSTTGTLTDADIDDIYTAFISRTRFIDELGTVNTKISGEIDQVMALVDSAMRSASKHDASLTDVTKKLGATTDREAIRSLVETLVQTASGMQRDNLALEAPAQVVEAGDHPASPEPGDGAQRKPAGPAHHARQPEVLRRGAAASHRRVGRDDRASVADADRHRSLQ